MRICRICGRSRPYLSYEAQRVLAEISPIAEEDFRLVEWFYSLPADPEDKDLGFRRKDADKLAIHFPAEVDRARAYAKNRGRDPMAIARGQAAPVPATSPNYPPGARAWALSLRRPEDTEFRFPPRWSSMPGDLRDEWRALPAEQKDAWAAKEAAHTNGNTAHA